MVVPPVLVVVVLAAAGCSNVDGEYNSEIDEYNYCGRNFVGSTNTNTSSNSSGITRQDNR